MLDDILYEKYVSPPAPGEELPRHAHGEYQLAISFGFPGEYEYRGARHAILVGGLTVLHPGEAHVVRGPRDRDVAGGPSRRCRRPLAPRR